MTFPIDPRAPELRRKRYSNLPWRCQNQCYAQPGEGCKSGDGNCWPDPPTPLPLPRPDRYQRYYVGYPSWWYTPSFVIHRTP